MQKHQTQTLGQRRGNWEGRVFSTPTARTDDSLLETPGAGVRGDDGMCKGLVFYDVSSLIVLGSSIHTSLPFRILLDVYEQELQQGLDH